LNVTCIHLEQITANSPCKCQQKTRQNVVTITSIIILDLCLCWITDQRTSIQGRIQKFLM